MQIGRLLIVLLGLCGLAVKGAATQELERTETGTLAFERRLQERNAETNLLLPVKSLREELGDGGLGYFAARLQQHQQGGPGGRQATQGNEKGNKANASVTLSPVGARKFVLAAHPALQYLGRWNQPQAVPFDYLPNGTDTFFVSKANTSAETGWATGAVYLRVYGTTSVSLHKDPLYVLACFCKVGQWANWTSTTHHGQSGYAVTGLDPTKVYDLEFRFLFYSQSFTLRGFGLDLAPNAKPLPSLPSKQPVFDFIGDSISILMWGGSVMGSYVLEACRILAARCAVFAYPGLSLRTMPPVFNKAAPFLDAPPWNSSQTRSSYTPKAIFVNLGTNDFGWLHVGDYASGEKTAAFIDLYVAFLAQIRKFHRSPTVPIFLVYPFGYLTKKGLQTLTPITTMQTIVQRAGRNTYLIDTTGWLNNQNAENFIFDVVHPNSEGMVYLGDKLAFAAKRIGLGWKPGLLYGH